MSHEGEHHPLYPLVVIAGPTASGKSSLALDLAARLQAARLPADHPSPRMQAEIVSCDSVAVYRGLDIGSAKPSRAERARVPHHGLDLYDPDQPCTAGDYARHARTALADIRARGRLPIVAGGTGLYLRALLEGLAPAPPRNEPLRDRLRARAAQRGSASLHRLLTRCDPHAAAAIHPNDTPKLIRSLEVTLATRVPQTAQWAAGRDPLQGFSVFAIGLHPPREALYARIDARAAAMFQPPPTGGLLEETAGVLSRFGPQCVSLGALGYAQARAVLGGEMPFADAIAAAQQGHRNYAKRQLTWFRKQLRTLPPPMVAAWLPGFGDDAVVRERAMQELGWWLDTHVSAPKPPDVESPDD